MKRKIYVFGWVMPIRSDSLSMKHAELSVNDTISDACSKQVAL